ncbi:MAG TPA: hypothetical protein VNW46_18150 [Gemmatimonadaceae bacterium]|jgi:hypothetical protein|nr:hypothetical protein [Gemmatimonadaceae bacterium]
MVCTRKASRTTLLAALAVWGCSFSTAPNGGVPESSLHFLSPNPGAPSLVTDTVRFYAVAGQDRSASLYYHAVGGQTDSVQFLAFDVPAGALVQQPDGTPIATGDSLLITIAIADPTRLIVGFQPSGLVFHNGQPAALTLSYANADSGLTATGVSGLAMWSQEHAGDKWHKVPSNVNRSALTVTGRIGGFSVYATAY